ncbi:MAG: lipopolysaccharide biosynthesis protein [Ferruginibacter sp.]|nr:lipopolysaccharide biosynthesis protein [Ferruginibacter sp.]
MSLQKKTTTGFFWVIGHQISVQAINFIVLIILARVLVPADFGIIAMLQVFISIGMVLLDGGMASSLIRTINITNKDYSTVFYLNIIFSVFLYLLLFITAPLIAHFFKQPPLTAIVKVYGIIFILQALVSVQNTKLTKEMNFKLQLYMQLPATIIGAVAGIWFANNGYGAWSLVYMNLIRTTIFMAQHWIFTDWKPVFVIDKKLLQKHFNFGYKLSIIGIINTIYNNIYDIIIGKLFTPFILGLYNQANTLSIFPVQLISGAMDKVTYPAFSQIQQDDNKLKMVYRKVMQQIVFWIAPLMMLLIMCADPLFKIVLTDKWLPAVPYFQVLCIYAIMYPLQVYNINILKVKNRTDLLLKIELVKKTVGITGTIIAAYYGIFPLLWFKVFYGFFLFYMNTFYSGRLINYSMKEQLKDIIPIIFKSILIMMLCWSLNYIIGDKFVSYNMIKIIFNTIVFIVLYFLISYYSKTIALFEFWEIAKQSTVYKFVKYGKQK